jgi:transaldolase
MSMPHFTLSQSVKRLSTTLLEKLPVKIFADGADYDGIDHLYKKPFIWRLTANPTLMRKVGITDYETFAKTVLEVVKHKPISFEVFSGAFDQMHRQALGWILESSHSRRYGCSSRCSLFWF